MTLGHKIKLFVNDLTHLTLEPITHNSSLGDLYSSHNSKTAHGKFIFRKLESHKRTKNALPAGKERFDVFFESKAMCLGEHSSKP